MTRVRLDEDQRKVLEFLEKARAESESGQATVYIDGYVGVAELKRETVWPIRPPLDSLKRRGLVDHDSFVHLADRSWKITDAGREAIS